LYNVEKSQKRKKKGKNGAAKRLNTPPKKSEEKTREGKLKPYEKSTRPKKRPQFRAEKKTAKTLFSIVGGNYLG